MLYIIFQDNSGYSPSLVFPTSKKLEYDTIKQWSWNGILCDIKFFISIRCLYSNVIIFNFFSVCTSTINTGSIPNLGTCYTVWFVFYTRKPYHIILNLTIIIFKLTIWKNVIFDLRKKNAQLKEDHNKAIVLWGLEYVAFFSKYNNV